MHSSQRQAFSSARRGGSLILAAAAVFLASCGGGKEITLTLDANPPLSATSWAVVIQAYVRVKEGPSSESRDLGHLRKGSLAEVLGSERSQVSKVADRGLWYRLKAEGLEGWVRDSDLAAFASKAQAERASAGYR